VSFSLEIEPTTRQTVTPQLIEASQILGLSAAELEQTIMAELTSNPALELAEAPSCPRCGAVLDHAYCPTCRFDGRPAEAAPGVPTDHDSYYVPGAATAAADDFDPMSLVASEASPIERLLSDVATIVEPEDLPIAEHLLHSLDDRGYLQASLDEVAAEYARPIGAVEATLRAIQAVAPVGVGARDIRECLLLQLDHLERRPGDATPPGIRRVIADHLEDLAAHRYSRIARRLGLTTADVGEAHEFIRDQLTPCPLQNQEARWWKAPTRAPFVAPDVVVHIDRDGEFQIEIVESRSARIRLDPLYASLVAEMRRADEWYSRDERLHVRQHVGRAKLFLAAINQRHETLRRITACLLELQRDFVLHGVRELRPLTRGTVAEHVGLHESTVSRATANKYIMLPNGEVIPYSTFFVASLSIKDVIKEMVEKEQRALTDEEICERLRQQGIRIARRTVAKYRATLGILPSTFRQGPSARHTA
jgi:RNA polymerase sigma-54 factor